MVFFNFFFKKRNKMTESHSKNDIERIRHPSFLLLLFGLYQSYHRLNEFRITCVI
jgi:hypothetical protein